MLRGWTLHGLFISCSLRRRRRSNIESTSPVGGSEGPPSSGTVSVSPGVRAAPSGVALDIVQVVERIEDDATPRELLRILAHPDESVREAVLNALSNRFPNAVEQVLVPMIDDESPNLRVQALRLARSLKSSTIREMLVAQVHANKFHTLPFTERRLTMETLHAIEPKLAEQACVDLARKKLNITLDPAMHTTRIMAITFLGETGLSRAGWEALEDAARRFPGNPQNVRDAATAAMDRWRSRAQ